MIIDIHAHVYLDPRIRPYPDAATPFMSARQQIEAMDRLGVDKAVILPLNSAECPAETQSIGEVLLICEQYPGRFIPFCHIDPRLAKHPLEITAEDFDFLLGQYKDLGCKGIGELTARIPWTSHPMLCLLESAARLGLPVTFHTITPDGNSYGVIDGLGLPGLEQVLERFPDLVLFGHSQAFWSEISGDVRPKEKNGYPKGPVAPGGTLSRLFRKCPGLHGDISAGSGFNALTRDPAFGIEFMNEFQDRLLLGLDYCSPMNDPQQVQWLTRLRDEGQIAAEVFGKIVWRNADRLLGLGLTETGIEG